MSWWSVTWRQGVPDQSCSIQATSPSTSTLSTSVREVRKAVETSSPATPQGVVVQGGAPSGTGRRMGLQEVATDSGRGRESPCPQVHDRPTALDRQAHNVEDRQAANLELQVDRPP